MGAPLVAQMYIECVGPHPIFEYQTNDRIRLTYLKHIFKSPGIKSAYSDPFLLLNR